MLGNVTARFRDTWEAVMLKMGDTILDDDSRHLGRQLQRMALTDTAQFMRERGWETIQSFPNRFRLLEFALAQATNEGMFLEFGVYKGASINHAAAHTSRTIYGFDSFEGLPERWRDGWEMGKFKLDRLPPVRKNVVLVKGWFDQSLPPFLKEHPEPVSFLYVDCDLYSSTRTVFDLLGQRIAPGTIIGFDEYFNYPGWREGEHKAFEELVVSHGLSYEPIGYCRNGRQLAVRITNSRKAE